MVVFIYMYKRVFYRNMHALGDNTYHELDRNQNIIIVEILTEILTALYTERLSKLCYYIIFIRLEFNNSSSFPQK